MDEREPVVPLREHYDALFAERDRRDAVLAKLYDERERAARDRADILAEALKDYKISANEWRGTVQDLIGKNKGIWQAWGVLLAVAAIAIAVLRK